MKKVLRYKLNPLLTTIKSQGSLRELTSGKEVDASIVFEMDDGEYRILYGDYLIPVIELDTGEITCLDEDNFYLPRCGSVSDVEFRAQEYNRKLYMNNGSQDYINAIYFLDEDEYMEDSFLDESLERVIEEIEENQEDLSLLEVCERLQDKYDEMNSNLFLID